MCVCARTRASVRVGCISSFSYILLNIIDVLSNRRMYVMITGWNWLIHFSFLTGSQILSDSSWTIISGAYIAKVQYNVLFILVYLFFNLVLYMATLAKVI